MFDHQAQNGVVHALVLGCWTRHVDVQVAEGQVTEDEDASVPVHARDRGFEGFHERGKVSERQPNIELVGDADGRDGLDFSRVSTDSRSSVPGDLFVAIVGASGKGRKGQKPDSQ